MNLYRSITVEIASNTIMRSVTTAVERSQWANHCHLCRECCRCRCPQCHSRFTDENRVCLSVARVPFAMVTSCEHRYRSIYIRNSHYLRLSQFKFKPCKCPRIVTHVSSLYVVKGCVNLRGHYTVGLQRADREACSLPLFSLFTPPKALNKSTWDFGSTPRSSMFVKIAAPRNFQACQSP